MLSIVYKLISKLLVVRLSPHNKDIISPQQTRFVLGCFILENIFLAWLTHNRVVCHNIQTLFFRLDFEKVFDQVDHPYIWVVLERTGLGALS